MATLKVYHTASPFNAVKKALGTAVTLSTDIVLPPSFDLYGDAIRVTSDTASDNRWNYAELTGAPAGGTWYYFIDRIEYLGGTDTDGAGYALHLRVDPLMTWQAQILSASLYVARNELDYNINLPDASLAQLYIDERVQSHVSDPITSIVSASADPTIVVQIANGNGVELYCVDQANFHKMCGAFWSQVSFQTLIQPDPINNIVRCFAVPWTIAELQAAGFVLTARTDLYIGSVQISPSDFVAYSHYPGYGNDARVIKQVDVPLTRSSDGWKSKNDHYHIILPYCGILDLAAAEVYTGTTNTEKSVTIRFILDIVTGDVTAEVFPDVKEAGVTTGSRPIHYATGNCSISLPMTATNATERLRSAVGSMVSFAASAVTAYESFATTNPIGLGASIGLTTGAMNQGLSANKVSSITAGTMGGGTAWAIPQNVYVYYSHARFVLDDANYARAHGRPLYAIRTGSALSGFTICENVRIQPTSANAAAAAQIKSLLESGVYFDNGY